MYQQPQVVRPLLRRLSLGRLMEDMGSKDEFEELFESVKLIVNLAKKGIMSILRSNIKLEMSEDVALALPETALRIVIDYSKGGGGLERNGFVQKETPQRVTEDYYLTNLYRILGRIYNRNTCSLLEGFGSYMRNLKKSTWQMLTESKHST